MIRQNLFSDEWDGDDEEDGTRHRVFWRPDYARMGATLYELGPGAPGMRMHMHFGAEEMFFVLSGRPDGFATAQQAGFASNGFGEGSPGGYGLAAVFVAEAILTGIFIAVILSVTAKKEYGVRYVPLTDAPKA